MPDVRLYFDAQCLFAYHLAGKEVLVTIERVTAGELVGEGGKKTKKPMVHFVGKEVPLALNKTNVATIASAYGHDTTAWIGKKIVLYPTTTTFGRDTRECIRVKIPKTREAKVSESAPVAHLPREPGCDDE